MNKSLLLILAAVSGTAGGLAVWALLDHPPAAAGPGAPGAGQPSAASAVDSRIGELERQVQTLHASLTTLQRELEARGRTPMAPPPSPGAPGPAGMPPEPLAEAFAGADLGSFVDSRLEAVLEARDEAERKAREERAARARVEWLDARMQRLAAELGLTEFQSGEMRRILGESEAKRDELFRTMRESGEFDRESVATAMRNLRSETEAELQIVLTPDQMERYRELGASFGGQFRGGPGGFFGDRGAGFGAQLPGAR